MISFISLLKIEKLGKVSLYSFILELLWYQVNQTSSTDLSGIFELGWNAQGLNRLCVHEPRLECLKRQCVSKLHVRFLICLVLRA